MVRFLKLELFLGFAQGGTKHPGNLAATRIRKTGTLPN